MEWVLNMKYTDKIFKPFERLHGRNEYEGTGIGLAICENIILQHGGSIRAESRMGQGSKFTVCLPENQKPGEAMGSLR